MTMLALRKSATGSLDAGAGFAAGSIEKEYCLCRFLSTVVIRDGNMSKAVMQPETTAGELTGEMRCSESRTIR